MMEGRKLRTRNSGKLRHRLTNIALILMMLLALLPPAGVSAASELIMIEHLYTADDISESDYDKVGQFTLNPIVLEVVINDIAPDQIHNLFYEITNHNTKRTIVNKENKAIPNGGPNNVKFEGVMLTEGLNKITVKLEIDGVIRTESRPAWAFYTPSTRIENLRINDAPFDEDEIYPTELSSNTPWASIIEISGDVFNATGVEVIHLNKSDSYLASVFGNYFSVIADHEDNNSSVNFQLEAGDNLFKFIASNPSHDYHLERTVIYDDGRPFVFRASLDGQRLIEEPTLVKPTSGGGFEFRGKAKVDRDENNNLEFNTLDVYFNASHVATVPLNASNLDPAMTKTNRYDVYNLNFTVNSDDISANDRYQNIQFVFSHSFAHNNTWPYSKLGFYYMDPTRPYIQSVARITSDDDETGTRISESAETDIAELPQAFYVYADENTEKVHVYIDRHEGAPIVADPTSETGKFRFELGDLTSGQHRMIIVPVDSSDNEFEAGQRMYYIRINSTPSLIFTNAHNGMVIEDLSLLEADCPTGSGTTKCAAITGRTLNIPDSGVQIKVTLNGFDVSNYFELLGDKRFLLRLSLSGVNSLVEGRNTFAFEITTPTQTAKSKLEIYRFINKAPEISSFEIKEEDPQHPQFFKETIGYSTAAEHVVLTGRVANVDKIEMIVHRNAGDGSTSTGRDIYAREGGVFKRQNESTESIIHPSFSGSDLETVKIGLAKRGVTTIELRATNSETGIIAMRMITITQSAPPYSIVYPAVYVNENKNWQANINSNYTVVRVKAEGADSVEYNREPAVLVDKENKIFEFTVYNLRAGKNDIKFTIVSGDETLDGLLVVMNANQAAVGAQYMTNMNNRIRVFNNQLELRFDRGTSLMRKGGDSNREQYLTTDRKILFGIANELNGRIESDNASIMPQFTSMRDDRFQTASPLYWIDAGMIPEINVDLHDAYNGTGNLPYHNGMYFLRPTNFGDVVPSKPAQLTIQYDPNIRDSAWRYLTVHQFKLVEIAPGRYRHEWVNLGGVVNTKNKTITVPVDSFGFFQVMYMDRSFDDVVTHEWARNDLDTLYSKGYMAPKAPPSAFLPNDPITRGEFITMLVKAYDLPLDYQGEPTFTDVRPRPGVEYFNDVYMYDYRYIETAARYGVVRGTSGGRFQPETPISRQDAAVMIARIANLKLDDNLEKVTRSLQRSFTDALSIDDYTRSAVLAVTNRGLITGKPNAVLGGEKQTYYFDPDASLMRSETAAIAIRVLQAEKKIPR